MRKEVKDVLHLLLMLMPIFIGLVLFWFYSPMYADVKARERLAAQEYLSRTYFYPDVVGREWLIEKYNFTDNEINPSKILHQFINETNCNQNLGELK